MLLKFRQDSLKHSIAVGCLLQKQAICSKFTLIHDDFITLLALSFAEVQHFQITLFSTDMPMATHSGYLIFTQVNLNSRY